MIKCCHKCTDERAVGCHSWCKKYKDEKTAHEAKLKSIQQQKIIERYEQSVSATLGKAKRSHRPYGNI